MFAAAHDDERRTLMIISLISVKKRIPVLLCVGILILCSALLIAGKPQTPYDCLKKSEGGDFLAPSELLYQETLDTGFDIVLYADQRGLYNFGVTEKAFLGYKKVGISGSLGIYNDDTYLYSAFYDGKTLHNVCWGILTDDSVTEVFLDNVPCNIADTPYNFRIFWLMDLEIDDPASPTLPSSPTYA